MSTFEEQEIAALRQRIVRLEDQMERLYRHLGVRLTDNSFEIDDSQIIEALRAGNIIAAIKRYREITGVGLADAKSAVESLKARLRI